MLVNYSVLPGSEAFPKAKDAAEKALALDENLAEAHAAGGHLLPWEWNWAEAGREYRRAIQLNPNYSSARQWYASLLAVIGQTDEALEEAKQARKLDPFSPIIASHPAWINYLSRNAEGAIREARQALKLDPNSFPRGATCRWATTCKANTTTPSPSFKEPFSATKSTLVKSELGYAYAKAGRREDALRVIDELQRSPGERRLSIPFRAHPHRPGRKRPRDRSAREGLRRARERMVWLRADPRFDPLRLDPRFNDLLTRMGLSR